MIVFSVNKSRHDGYYEVTVCDGLIWHCPCKGFQYRRHCRHIECALKALRSGVCAMQPGVDEQHNACKESEKPHESWGVLGEEYHLAPLGLCRSEGS